MNNEGIFGVIYKITNLINNKIYVGKFNLQRNAKSVKFENYWGSGKLIKYAIKKHGKENFKKEIIENCVTKEELIEKERYWIKELNSFRPVGYNIGTGGEGQDNFTHHPDRELIFKKIGLANSNRKVSKETRLKLSESHKGKSFITEEGRKRLSEAKKGVKNPKTGDSRRGLKWIFNGSERKLVSAEELQAYLDSGWLEGVKGKVKFYSKKTEKVSKKNKKCPNLLGKNNGMYGKTHSEEAKEKIREANRRRVWTKEQREHLSNIKKGKNSKVTETYIIFSPNNERYEVNYGLKNFCEEQKLSVSGFQHILYEKSKTNNYKGWKIYSLNEKSPVFYYADFT